MSEIKKPFHEMVAEQLIAQLQQGTAPWQLPWQPGAPGAILPFNPTTDKRYRGINAILLMSQGHDDQRWMTYRQATDAGAQVRQGEKGTPIQYWKFHEEQVRRDDHGKPVLDNHGKPVIESVQLERPRVFFATVFNAQQVDGLPPMAARTPPPWQPIERAEQILQASGVAIYHSEVNRAFYRASSDTIHLPGKGQFPTADNYYAAALHELGHATGHGSRLDRDLTHPFGSEGYAREELRAEIASMMLGDALGVGHDPGQHAAYVGSWIAALQRDPLEIFRAAADAEKIQAFVQGLVQQQEQTIDHRPTPQASTEAQVTQPVGVTQAPVNVQNVSTSATETAASISYRHKGETNQTVAATDRQSRNVTEATVQNENRPMESDRHFIKVPFKQKDDAKALGARWDRERQSWYVPDGIDRSLFTKWIQDAATAESPRVDKATSITGDGDTDAGDATTPRQYLAVPYSDRAAAKAAGAVWDKAAKSWYAGPNANLDDLSQWKPDRALFQQGPAMMPREEFAQAMRSVGCIVDGEHPIMDGKKHRITVEGEKHSAHSGSGFYVGHLDGHPAGYVKNNKTGAELTWKAKGYVLDPQQKAQLQAEAASKRIERSAEQARVHEQTVRRVQAQVEKLVPVDAPTPYMQSKGIAPQAGVFTDETRQKTYIPMIDVDGKQWSMQIIDEAGTKRFARGSRKEGNFHPVGGMSMLARAPALVIAEGYATASSVSSVLECATVAAFDAGNLTSVAQALHSKFPDKPVVIVGDDDCHLEVKQKVNPGRTKAREAANAVGGYAIFPVFAPGEQNEDARGFSDFNDLATKSVLGKEGLDRQLRSVVDAVIEKHHAQGQRQIQQAGRAAKLG